MLRDPVRLAVELREAAAHHELSVPQSARCETFWASAGAEGSYAEGLCCQTCTQPLLRNSTRYAMGAIMGGSAADRTALRKTISSIMHATGIRLPDARLLHHESFSMLLVPWAFRGEMRAVLQQAAAGARMVANAGRGEPDLDLSGRVVGIADSTAEAVANEVDIAFVSSLPGDAGAGSFDYDDFRRQLTRFGMAYDGPVQAALRLALTGEGSRTWHFPLTCTVVESSTKRRVTWTVQFEDLETLERAYMLLDPVMREMERLGSRLRPGDARPQDMCDEGETQIPALCIATDGNSRQARVEMVRLLKDLILTLDRLAQPTEA
ncbi:hypothetical protein [Ramlibacter sp. AN1133]|uniref:hypothetical protein n=1 Tax=Ramlibacter sp. AN1133 TaxID=3133429 RepID=UPI0030BF6ED8